MLYNIFIASFRDLGMRKAFNHGDPGMIRVDRKSVLGNPFPMADESKRNEVCDKYRDWLWNNTEKPEIKAELLRILNIARKQNVTLFCWCAPRRCHAETIREALKWLDVDEAFHSRLQEEANGRQVPDQH